MIGLLVLFGLDALQMRGGVAPAEKPLFDASAVRTVLKDSLVILALLALTTSNFRLWRATRRAVRSRKVVLPPVMGAPPSVVVEARANG